MLATYPHELKALKEKLRHNLKTTSLFDAALFAKHIESAFAQMYQRLNEGLEPDHFYVESQALDDYAGLSSQLHKLWCGGCPVTPIIFSEAEEGYIRAAIRKCDAKLFPVFSLRVPRSLPNKNN